MVEIGNSDNPPVANRIAFKNSSLTKTDGALLEVLKTATHTGGSSSSSSSTSTAAAAAAVAGAGDGCCCSHSVGSNE